jgi:hypothetical protein
MQMMTALAVPVPLLKDKPAHTSEGIGRGFALAISKTLRKKFREHQLTDTTLFSCLFDETNNVSKESVCSVNIKFLNKQTNLPETVFFALDKVKTRKTGVSVASN